MRLLSRMLGVVLTTLMATSATAGPLTISNVGGLVGWDNSNPVAGVTISNQGGSLVDSIRWGDPATANGQSGYDFDPVDGAINPVLGTPFLLGTFTHLNQPVYPPSLVSVDYDLGFDTNGAPGTLAHTFSFVHNETSNAEPCPAGPAGTVPSVSICDDFVVISNLLFNSLITVGGDVYFFNLLGFSTDGGLTTKHVFQSVEGGNNSAGLYAIVTGQPVSVPEPALLLLLGGGVAAAVRRRAARARTC